MTKQPFIVLDKISKTYHLGEQVIQVLNSVSLSIHAGEMLAIVGASGSGKSTLMNIMGLLDKPNQGEYYLNGQAMGKQHQDRLAQLRNEHLGFVFQQFNLLPRFTAKQNVALPLTYRQLNAKAINQQVEQALAWVGMQDYANHRPTQLSGGQQQRVAIARALVTNPQVILADEPTGALDSRTGCEIMKLFLALHQQGRTLILVTHDEQVALTCQRRILITDGQIVSEQNHDA